MGTACQLTPLARGRGWGKSVEEGPGACLLMAPFRRVHGFSSQFPSRGLASSGFTFSEAVGPRVSGLAAWHPEEGPTTHGSSDTVY